MSKPAGSIVEASARRVPAPLVGNDLQTTVPTKNGEPVRLGPSGTPTVFKQIA
jgi:hypothetical protein